MPTGNAAHYNRASILGSYVVSQKSLCFQPLPPLYESKPPYASATPDNVL